MPSSPRGIGSLFVAHLRPSLCLLALWILSSPALSADVVYKYVDDSGVVFFTDNYQQIPPRYMSRVQALDPATMQPLTPKSGTPAASSTSSAPSAPAATEAQQAPGASGPQQVAETWIDWFSRQNFPLPTQFQFGVGLTTLVLIIGAVIVMRVSQNPLFKLLLKASIMFVIGGAVYAIYLSGLNERVSQATHEQTGRTASGKEILGEVKGKAGQVKQFLGTTALDPVRGAIEKTKAAAVRDVTKTVNEANQANRDLQKKLGEIEPASRQ